MQARVEAVEGIPTSRPQCHQQYYVNRPTPWRDRTGWEPVAFLSWFPAFFRVNFVRRIPKNWVSSEKNTRFIQ